MSQEVWLALRKQLLGTRDQEADNHQTAKVPPLIILILSMSSAPIHKGFKRSIREASPPLASIALDMPSEAFKGEREMM